MGKMFLSSHHTLARSKAIARESYTMVRGTLSIFKITIGGIVGNRRGTSKGKLTATRQANYFT